MEEGTVYETSGFYLVYIDWLLEDTSLYLVAVKTSDLVTQIYVPKNEWQHNPSPCWEHRQKTVGLQLKGTLNLNSVNQLIFVIVKCGVLFEVRTEFLNNI
jgi:hypothetical protein